MEMLAWRRALSPAEHASLATDATQFLIWPEDDILAQMFGSGSLISVLPGDAYGTSAYGRRAWGLPPLVAGGVNSFIWRDNSLGNQPSRNPHEMIPY